MNKPFTAMDARNLQHSKVGKQVDEIVEKIKSKCMENDSSTNRNRIFLYEPVSKDVLDEFKKRGFGIDEGSSIAIQKDGIYGSISW